MGHSNQLEQTSALKCSIGSLEALGSEVKASIEELQRKDGDHADEIAVLQELDQQLQQGIADLTDQLAKDLSDAETWAKETFVTLEVYDGLLTELQQVQADLSTTLQGLGQKITDSAGAIKTWVGEVMASYYTSEQVDQKLQVLMDRLTVMEAKLDQLLRVFKITFDQSDVLILAGGSATVNYTIEGATPTTVVKAFVQNGWSAKVNRKTDDSGEIVVKAPNPIVDEEVVVIVYDGEYRTIMSSINFLTGVITPSVEAIDAPEEGGEFAVTVTSNMNYTVAVPEADQGWLSIVPQTKAMREDRLVVKVSENMGAPRRSVISLLDAAGNLVQEIAVVQNGPVMVLTVNGVEVPFVKVEGGTFMMGMVPEPGSGIYDTEPVHQVTLSDFYIGQYEVTQELWQKLMGSLPDQSVLGPELPVAKMTRPMILENFIPVLQALTGNTFSLPTEAQWEFAARGGIKSRQFMYSGSDDWDKVAWNSENSEGQPHPVGQLLPNELGLYDMSGNVMEWVLDWYQDYPEGPQTDPMVSSGRVLVCRGGSWSDDPVECRNAVRRLVPKESSGNMLGFRLVMKLPEN